jgi:PAS domain S-box-containing protein
MSEQERIVLIVDDSIEERTTYRSYLDRESTFRYTVWEAESAEAALQLCDRKLPDCIVLDYFLPDRNGLDLLAELKNSTGENCPPIIMLNDRGNEAIAIQAFKIGVEDYLIESEITLESFLYVTRTAIENFRLRQKLRESEERYRAIVEDQTELICRFLPDCTLTFVNGAYSRYFESTPERLVGQSFLNLIPESHHDCVRQDIARLSASQPENAVIRHEHPVIKANGEIGWQEWTNRAIFNSNGEVIELQAVGRDITDRKQTEIAIKKTNERFELAAAVNCLIYDYEIESNKVERSGGMTQLFGYSPQEIEPTADWWYEKIHPSQREAVKEAKRVALLGCENSICLEYQVYHRDGHYVWVQDRASLLRDESGRAVRIVGFITDISARKLAEQQLRESEDRLQIGVRVAGVGLARFDYASNTVEISPEAAVLYGFTANDSLITRDRIHATFHPEETAEMEETIRQVLDPMGDGWFDREHRVVWPNGEVRWLHVRKQVFFERSQNVARPSYAILAAIDVTERKQTEARIQHQLAQIEAIYATAPIGLCFLDLERRFVRINKRLAQINGLTVSEHLGRTVRDILPELAEVQEPIFEQICQTGIPILDIEVQGTTPAQPEVQRHWVVSYYPLKATDGEVLGINITVLEITDRKQAEAERERLLAETQAAREVAEEANRSKNEFVAIIAHELRSPINSVAGWAKLLRTQQFEPASADRALEAIERGTQTQVQLIEDLLDLSRIDCGTLRLTLAPVPLRSVARSAIDLVRPMAEAKQIAIETQLAESAVVFGDLNRLQQIMVNLLTNAIKFTPAGGRVSIKLESVETMARITVGDNGRGIDPAFLPQIFQRFQQAQRISGSQGGLGLGLAIVKNLVEMHGGTISAESPGIGEGATFTVWLPLLEAENAIAFAAETSDPNLPPLAGIQILAVDDEPDSLELLRFILEDAGAEVQTATSGSEALETLAQFKFDLLISDIGMPDMNGYELVQQIGQLYPDRQIITIAVTAYANSSPPDEAIGFERYLYKPIDPEVLVPSIIRLIGNESRK